MKILLWLNDVSNPGVSTSYATLCATLDYQIATVRLTSIYNPQIGGNFTETSAGLTNLFYACKDQIIE